MEHHCDSSEGYYAHTPGLKVVAPSTVEDAYSLLRSAIEDPDPVIFLEPKKLYFARADVELTAREPIGRAVVRRPGRDATLIAYGPSVDVALRSAEAAAAEGRDIEVIDIRSIVPFDDETVTASVRKTGRCIVIQEAQGFAGVGAEIAARVQEPVFPPSPCPGAPGQRLRHPLPRSQARASPSAQHRPGPGRRRPSAVERHSRHPLGGDGMSNQVFMLPDLGEGLAEADIAEWHVKVGDVVTIDQIVVEVETAKAAVDVPIPFAGTVIELHGKGGDTLKVGTPLITVSGGESVDAVVSANHERYREEERAGSGNVLIGYGTSEDAPLRRRRAAPSVRVISPIVRKLASDNSIDLATISGSGAGGVITRADVEAGANFGPETETSHATDQRIPIKGLRKVVADKLSTSRREIPDATTWVDVDATELLAARAEINKSLPDSDKISLMALLWLG